MAPTEGSSPRRTCLGTPCITWERALRRYCLRAEGGKGRGKGGGGGGGRGGTNFHRQNRTEVGTLLAERSQ